MIQAETVKIVALRVLTGNTISIAVVQDKRLPAGYRPAFVGDGGKGPTRLLAVQAHTVEFWRKPWMGGER